MPTCPNCHISSPDVYVGFSTVECPNPECQSYKPKKEDGDEINPKKDNVPLEKFPTEDDYIPEEDDYIPEEDDYIPEEDDRIFRFCDQIFKENINNEGIKYDKIFKQNINEVIKYLINDYKKPSYNLPSYNLPSYNLPS